ncbi:MAG TPA: hypothetical protein PK721_06795, partial [Flexilinea sp.]|nr:hypothetical protein [Flexilinea sp.]
QPDSWRSFFSVKSFFTHWIFEFCIDVIIYIQPKSFLMLEFAIIMHQSYFPKGRHEKTFSIFYCNLYLNLSRGLFGTGHD